MAFQLLSPLFGASAMEAAWTDRATIAAMLRFEAALAEAEADCGLVPRAAVAPIAAVSAADFDLEALAQAAAHARSAA